MGNISVIIFFLVFSELGFSQNEKVDYNSVPEELRSKTEAFILSVYGDKEMPKLSGKDATSYFRKRIKEVDIIDIAKAYDDYYGEITESLFVEAYRDIDIIWLRYKTKREESNRYFEIRIGINEKNKYVALSNKRFWSDKFYGFSDSPPFKRLDTLSISSAVRQRNDEFAFRSYNNCHKDSLFKVDETNMVRRSLRKDFTRMQHRICDSIKQNYGKLNEIKFEQVLTDSVYTKIYRYKVQFDNVERSSEVRIFADLDDRYKGIFVIETWFDKFLNLKKAIEKSKNLLGN